MAGINNLGNTSNVQPTLQLKPTAKVDPKNKGEEVGDAKPAAVWVVNCNSGGPAVSKGYDPKLGDVRITIAGDKVYYHRKTIDAQGYEVYIAITADDIQDSDFEADRGDIRS